MTCKIYKVFLLSLLSLATVNAQIEVLASGTVANTSQTTLPAACVKALEGSVQCTETLRDVATSDYFFGITDSVYKSTCTTACNSSLATYHKNVVSACGKTSSPWPGHPATYYGDILWSSFNLTCLADPKTGASCMSYIYKASQSYKNDMAPTSLPKSILCSPCIIAMYRLFQSTPYSPYGTQMAGDWAQIQKTCGKTYPTALPVNPTNFSAPNFEPSGYPVTTGCFSGSTYKAISGDSCTAISKSKGVSTGGLISLNNLLFDCTNLKAGQSLCLPQKCTIYTVQTGDSCASIIASKGIEFSQFLSWNPLLDPYCTSLISGWSVCVSQPGTIYTGTTIDGATVTQTAVYATATVPPPSNIAHDTTKQCGKYYEVKSGDSCYLIALNNTVTVELFEDINPSINEDCTNLIPALSYCVLPTADWNSTDTSTTTSSYVTAPSPTPSGTTTKCYEWHTVVKDDNCSLIEQQYDITMAQLQSWNPSLNDACTNLILGDSYCVNGDTASAGSAATASNKQGAASTKAASASNGRV